MEKKILTCPLTGIEFEIMVMDGDLVPFAKAVTAHPLEHYPIEIYMNERFELCIPYKYFNHIMCVTRKEAGEILEVTPQRITQLITDEVIPVHYVIGEPMMKLCDVLAYKNTRKIGRPAKEA